MRNKLRKAVIYARRNDNETLTESQILMAINYAQEKNTKIEKVFREVDVLVGLEPLKEATRYCIDHKIDELIISDPDKTCIGCVSITLETFGKATTLTETESKNKLLIEVSQLLNDYDTEKMKMEPSKDWDE